MIHSAPLPPAAGPPSRGRRGEGTTRLREYTLWSMYALLVLWPPCLALSYARAPVYTPWTLPFLACQTAEAVACGITLHHVAAYEIDGHPVPRWCRALLAATTAAGAVTAVGWDREVAPGGSAPMAVTAPAAVVAARSARHHRGTGVSSIS